MKLKKDKIADRTEREWDICSREEFLEFAEMVYEEGKFVDGESCVLMVVLPKNPEPGKFPVGVLGSHGFGGRLEHLHFLLQFITGQQPIQDIVDKFHQAMIAEQALSTRPPSGIVAARGVVPPGSIRQ